MDRIDLRLLAALQQDADRTNASLAEVAGLAPSSCLRRIRRLKRSGVIEGTVALLDMAKVGRPLTAIVEVELDRHDHRHVRDFVKRAGAERAVATVYTVTGETDVVVIVNVADMREFDGLCDRLLRLDLVKRFRTSIVTGSAKGHPVQTIP